MVKQIADRVWAVGKVIQKPDVQFSFLSYLIRGRKNILIDTVPNRAASKWGEELAALLSGERIDALILNHAEEDHSGALPQLLGWDEEIPIYCTLACRERLKSVFPHANFVCVEDGSCHRIGDVRLRFLHTPGLHWEDNMVTFLEEDRILFSNDLFGQYVGRASLVDDEVPDEEMASGLMRYFDNVFAASTAEQRRVLVGIKALGAEQIAPGHGVVLRTKLARAFLLYEGRCL